MKVLVTDGFNTMHQHPFTINSLKYSKIPNFFLKYY